MDPRSNFYGRARKFGNCREQQFLIAPKIISTLLLLVYVVSLGVWCVYSVCSCEFLFLLREALNLLFNGVWRWDLIALRRKRNARKDTHCHCLAHTNFFGITTKYLFYLLNFLLETFVQFCDMLFYRGIITNWKCTFVSTPPRWQIHHPWRQLQALLLLLLLIRPHPHSYPLPQPPQHHSIIPHMMANDEPLSSSVVGDNEQRRERVTRLASRPTE